MTLGICLAGATGWVGEALCPAIASASDLRLAGAVARKSAGRPVPGVPEVAISSSVADSLKAPTDLVIDYTHPSVVKANALAASCSRARRQDEELTAARPCHAPAGLRLGAGRG
jgi:4-hydroxy-tetrahydrodipicolinate reductase